MSTTTSPITNAMGYGASTAPTAPGGKMGKDEFIKLLVAQLKNQDPLDPAKGQEMAAQLAQFSSVEQLMNLNSSMSSQAAANAQLLGMFQANAAMGAIGRTVLASGNQLTLDGSGDPRSVTAHVGSTGGSATLTIRNSAGREVGVQQLGLLGGGESTIDLSEQLRSLPAGTYTYEVAVTDAKGRPVDVQHFMTARIDAVQMSAIGPILLAGDMRVPFGDVIEIRN